jgi:hypothetical protein
VTTPLRVLIVEDSEDDALLLARELKRGGFDVAFELVETGDGLTTALGKGGWDVVFADFTMPKFRGTAALDMVRQRDADLPFIFVSGTIGEDVAVEAMKAGANDYVMKGNLKRLIPAVTRELRESAIRRERHRSEADRRAAEQALRVSEERHRLLFEHIADMIMVLDREGVIRFSSPSVRAILGHAPSDMVGRPSLEFVHPDDVPQTVAKRVAVTGSHGAIVMQELRMRHRDGSWRVIDAVLRNLLDHADVGGVVVTSRDVTDRRRLEAEFLQAQKLESVGRLAGGIAHDFNNLLTAVMGNAELLLTSSDLGGEHREDVEEIMRAAERATTLTRQLLAFSRRQVLDLRPMDLNAAVLTVQQILQRLLGEDVELITRLATPLGVVRADVGQIEQVLLNLAVNGRDAMPGGGRLTIETANVELPAAPASGEPVISAGRYVTLVVGDTGEGIDPEARAHIFEPFFTTKAPGEGTGLGLATVYGIVKQSGGHIEVDSEPGRGTTFTIYLPRVDEVAEPTAPPPEAGPSEHGTETILVVEDERAVRELAARGLREHGYTVLTAERAEEAIRLLDEERPPVDLLLTDAVLPGASGLTLASVATARRPGLQVVYMSGYAHEALARQGMLEPGMILIEKPFTPATLARKVREVLDRR